MILPEISQSNQSVKPWKNHILAITLIISYILWIVYVYPANFNSSDFKTNNKSEAEIVLPELLTINIKDAQETSDLKIIINGETKKEMKISINGSESENKDGKFSKEIELIEGDNAIEIKIENLNGYFLKKIYTIKRIINASGVIPAPQSQINNNPEISSYQCSSSLADTMLNFINTYRVSQGKNSLSRQESMDIASCNHSIWMSANNTLSHTGENGSQFYDRCQTAGSACDAENIANGTTDIATIFNLWKNSAGHNANMLGDHFSIGIGESNGYWTTVFY